MLMKISNPSTSSSIFHKYHDTDRIINIITGIGSHQPNAFNQPKNSVVCTRHVDGRTQPSFEFWYRGRLADESARKRTSGNNADAPNKDCVAATMTNPKLDTTDAYQTRDRSHCYVAAARISRYN